MSQVVSPDVARNRGGIFSASGYTVYCQFSYVDSRNVFSLGRQVLLSRFIFFFFTVSSSSDDEMKSLLGQLYMSLALGKIYIRVKLMILIYLCITQFIFV